MAEPPSKRRRLAISDSQRRALRQYHQEHQELKHSELAKWFEEQWNRPIGQASISTILSSKYSYVDNLKLRRSEQGTKRHTPAEHPVLEEALFQVQQQWQRSNTSIHGWMLKEAAHHLWLQIPQLACQQEPAWSNGWLEGFQRRHQLRSRYRHGEAASVPEGADEAMEQARVVIARYPLARDVYNMDESGLFWKATPDHSITTERLAGRKQEKARITTIHCCNGDGSDLLPLWIIGKSANPRAFGSNKRNITGLPMQYRANSKAWINTIICTDWLLSFARHTQGRSVLLIMDNHSSHEVAAAELASHPLMSHVQVLFLPPNCTSKFQPLDQGIISTFKALYRRSLLRYLMDKALLQESCQINLLQAVRWAVCAWNELPAATIGACFRHSTCFGAVQGPLPRPAGFDEVAELAKRLEQAKVIKQAMDISLFINPPDEQVVDESVDDVVKFVAQQYQVEEPEDQQEQEQEVPKVTIQEAITALERLLLHEQQQEDSSMDIITALSRHEQVLRGRRLHGTRQTTLSSYFDAI